MLTTIMYFYYLAPSPSTGTLQCFQMLTVCSLHATTRVQDLANNSSNRYKDQEEWPLEARASAGAQANQGTTQGLSYMQINLCRCSLRILTVS
jgi:hypothetical protein